MGIFFFIRKDFRLKLGKKAKRNKTQITVRKVDCVVFSLVSGILTLISTCAVFFEYAVMQFQIT